MQRRTDKWMFRVGPPTAQLLGQICTCVSIVSVLVAIIWLAFSKSHHSGTTECMSNMKQIGLAILGYSEDYDLKLPTGCVVSNTRVILPSASMGVGERAAHPGYTHGRGVGWAGSVEPYLKSPLIFKCYEDPAERIRYPGTLTLYPISYALNQWLSGQSQAVSSAPETTVMAFECSGPRVDVGDDSESGDIIHSPIGDGASDPLTGIPLPGDAFDTPAGVYNMIVNNRGEFARHEVGGPGGGGGSMWLLSDGHVKFLRYENISVGKRPVSQSKLGNMFTASFNPNP